MFQRSFALRIFTFDAKTLVLGIDTSKELIPDFEEETGVKRSILGRHSVMQVVLEGGVQDGMMSVRVGQFETTVKIHTVPVEEHGELSKNQSNGSSAKGKRAYLEEEKIDVDGNENRQDEQR